MTQILTLIIILQVLDLVTTIIALRNKNLEEGNPFLKPLFDKFGVSNTLIIIKCLFIGLLLNLDLEESVLNFIAIGYGVVVCSNIRNIMKY